MQPLIPEALQKILLRHSRPGTAAAESVDSLHNLIAHLGGAERLYVSPSADEVAGQAAVSKGGCDSVLD